MSQAQGSVAGGLNSTGARFAAPLADSRLAMTVAIVAAVAIGASMLSAFRILDDTLGATSAQIRASMVRERARNEFVQSISAIDAAERRFMLTGANAALFGFQAAERRAYEAMDRVQTTHDGAGNVAAVELRRIRFALGVRLGELTAAIALRQDGEAAVAASMARATDPRSSRADVLQRVRDLAAIDAAQMDASAALATTRQRQIALLMIFSGIVTAAFLAGSLAWVWRKRPASVAEMPPSRETDSVAAASAEHRRSAEVSELSSHLQRRYETEKAALARELHDELGGTFAGTRMDIGWLRRQGRLEEPEHQVRWSRIERSLEGGLDFKRRIVDRLHPSLLDNLGFNAAARWFVEDVCVQAKLAPSLDFAEPEPQLNAAVSIALFRALEESLLNVVQHANASTVHVQTEFEQTASMLTLTIRDDGIGARREQFESLEHHGVRSMRQRIEACGGQFLAEPSIQGGTLITIRVPATAEQVA